MIVVRDVNLDGLNKTIAKYSRETGIGADQVVGRQAGLLKRDLVNLSPPNNRKQSENRIKERISNKFIDLGYKRKQEYAQGNTSKNGRQDVNWYAFTPRAIYGVAKELDYRNASVGDLVRLLPFISTKGRLVLPMRRKTNQKAVISKRIYTKPSTVKKVIKSAQETVGRLKAAWAIAWNDPRLQIKANLPAWVARHLQSGNAKGAIVVNLNRTNPTIEIISNASGVEKNIGVVRRAVPMRVKAMEKDMALYIAGIKKKP